MELFTLLAKLTLDTKEYDKSIQKLEHQDIEIQDPSLGLNTDEFYSKIANADNAEVDDIESELTLDDDDFTDKVDEANEADVDDIEAELTLNNGEYDSALDESKEKSEDFVSSIGSMFSDLKGVLVATGVAAVITGVVSTLKEGVELAKTHGDQIDKQSQKMNMSAKAYQEWSYALELSGASITDLNRGMRTWQQAVGDEEQTAKLGEAFEALGIDAEKAFKKLEKGENLDQLLEQTMYALADLNPGERGWIMETLFGKNATQLNALLNNTSDEIRDMRQEAEDLGLIMTDEEVKNAAEYNDAVTRMEQSVNALKESLVTDLLPFLTDAANTIAQIVAFFNPRTHGNTLSDQFKAVDNQLSENLTDIEATSEVALDLIDKLFAMGDAEKLTAEQQIEWKQSADWLIKNIPSLSDVIDKDTMSITANKDEIVETVKAWQQLSRERAIQGAIQDKQDALAQKTKQYYDALAEVETARLAYEEAYKKGHYETISDDTGDYEYWAYDTSKYWEYEKVKQKASGLKDEVETGTAELEQYIQGMETVLESVQTASDNKGTFLGTKTSADEATEAVNELGEAVNSVPDSKTISFSVIGDPYDWNPHHNAKGNWDVPYDNYPALLHRDEMVLTATQARKYRNGQGGDVNYDTIAEIVAVAVGDTLNKVNVLMSGEKVGDLTTRRVKNNINASSYSRLRAFGG